MKSSAYLLCLSVAVFFVVALAGCAATRTAAPTSEDDTDLNGFTHSLQAHGVYVTEQGPANLQIPADASRRLVLNRRDVVDVYLFRNEEAAEGEALEFAALYPRNDVYMKEDLVVVHHTRRDSGLSLTLHTLLGTTL